MNRLEIFGMVGFADQLHILPLAAQPHLNAFSEYFGFNDPATLILRYDFCSGQTV